MSTIQQVELTIEHARKGVSFGEALNRLLNNRDFHKVIEEGFLREEAVRLVHLKADPSMNTPADQAAIDLKIHAVGQFKSWLAYQRTQADQSQKTLAENSELLEYLRKEEAEGDA